MNLSLVASRRPTAESCSCADSFCLVLVNEWTPGNVSLVPPRHFLFLPQCRAWALLQREIAPSYFHNTTAPTKQSVRLLPKFRQQYSRSSTIPYAAATMRPFWCSSPSQHSTLKSDFSFRFVNRLDLQ